MNCEDLTPLYVFQVLDHEYSSCGIILLVKSSSNGIKVVKQQSNLFKPYKEIKSKIYSTVHPSRYIMFVPYRFEPGNEWYLELFSADSHWISMSPYFGETPNISDELWDSIWNLPENSELEVHKIFPKYRVRSE